MKWKNRLTNYNFWISIVSAVLLILQAFKFEFDIAYINEIATAVLGLLVHAFGQAARQRGIY